ncbi:3-phosphoglycerate kinase [Pseudomonas sp. LS1212]|uniref:3-phosphoglycerate kinase n=1 Tax=Pseudomonas sp. LS1212 TaxID=2972478 RepID=UPI00215BE0F8|nr:3-phosphoglycerate kinase [Pseudomonas sp. LS1212]UVJ45303.1 3-phosphoglycerate kinase [Pseudomonas sp. LS1212]
MKKCCVALLALLPMTVLAYPIDVEKKLDGVKIDYTAYDTDYDIGSITLNNYGDVAAQCKVVFTNGPETPRTRRVQIPAKQSKDVTAKFNRSIIKLRIKLDCKPV